MATSWPLISKNGQKTQKISIFEIFSKVEVQKLNISACLSRLIKLDEKKYFWIHSNYFSRPNWANPRS
jgi:hypothetical protein